MLDTYVYEGYHGKSATCGIEIISHNNRNVVVITELPSNEGTSVTNAIEIIINGVLKDYQLNLDDTSFVEHYPASDNREETFDLIGFKVSNKVVSEPTWERLRDIDLISLGIKK